MSKLSQRRFNQLVLTFGLVNGLVTTQQSISPGLLVLTLLAAWGIGLVLAADWGLVLLDQAIASLITPELIAAALIAIFIGYAAPTCGRAAAKWCVYKPVGNISQSLAPELRRPVLVWDGAPTIKRGAYLLHQITHSLLFYG